MSFEPKTQAFNSSISSVTIGTGDKAVTLGGINVLPFYAFDAPITNAPKIGVEITDHGMAAYPQAGLQEFYAGCQTVADMAKRVETMHGASFICLHFEGADPNGDNRSVEECVEIAKSVADATDLPSSSWAARTSRRTASCSARSLRRCRQEHSGSVRPERGLQDRRCFRRSGLRPEGGR